MPARDLPLLPTHQVEDITRRRLLAAMPTLVVLAAGISCGDHGDEASPASTTRTVETHLGPVNVPVRPERVVVFDRRGTLAYLLDLGITPIAAMSAPNIYGGASFHPLIEADVADIHQISSTDPDLEQVAALKPDLIIGYSGDALGRGYDTVSAIAPTVSIPIDFNNPEDELTMLGKVFGMEEKAATLIGDFEAEIAAVRPRLRSPGRVSIVLPMADGVRVYAASNLVGQIVTGLGGAIAPDVSRLNPDPSGNFTVLSFERVDAIDGDTIVILANLATDWMTYKQSLYEMPVFQILPAVKAGRIVEVESQAVFGTAGLRGQRQILEQLARAFA